jgi:alpha-tubulin suppressor-like RCC1 family protein
VAPGLTFKVIAIGDYYSLALDDQGKLYTFGYDKNRIIPTLVAPELTFRAIAAGDSHSLALDTKGKLYAWGDNDAGQLGLDDSENGKDGTIPTLIKSELTFRTIASGYSHSLALDTKSKLYAWGDNDSGQLGLGDHENGKNRTIPTAVFHK